MPCSKNRSYRDETVGVGPLPQLLLELLTLIDHDLPVVGQGDLESFQGTRGGAFEVDSRNVEAAAVTRAFEFLLVGQPVGRAAQVRADRLEGVDDVLAVIAGGADDPEAPFRLEPLVDILGS